MKESLKLLMVAGVLMFVGDASATHSKVPNGTPAEWMKQGIDTGGDPFVDEICRSLHWDYNSENAGAWSAEEVQAKLDKIYGYAVKEMKKICKMPKYMETQISVNSQNSGFGSKQFTIYGGSDDTHFAADQLGDSDNITFSVSSIAESGFMAYLIVKDCFKWVEKSNGTHLLIPAGVPSKRVIRELFAEFKNDAIDEDYKEEVEAQRKESKEFVAKNNEIGTGQMAAR